MLRNRGMNEFENPSWSIMASLMGPIEMIGIVDGRFPRTAVRSVACDSQTRLREMDDAAPANNAEWDIKRPL